MLTLEKIKELVNDPTLSDEDIKQIRDGFYVLAEIIYEQWKLETKSNAEKTLLDDPDHAGV
jgi:hypothetical protein